MASDYRLFAWQGMQLDVPRRWEMSIINGDEHEGYCRLDDGEMVRAEIRWQKGPSRGTIDDLVAEYFRKSKLNRDDLRIRRHLQIVELPDMEHECFVVHGDVDSMHLLARCACGRVGMVRLLYRRSESYRPIVRHVLGSYRDHPAGDMAPWSLYGLRVDVPKDYVLSNHSLHTGRMELEFERKRCVARLVRQGLAEMALRQRGLGEWLKADSTGMSGDPHARYLETERDRHHAVLMEAQGPGGLKRIFRKRPVLRTLSWHCEPSNSILSVAWRGEEESLPDFERIVASVACH